MQSDIPESRSCARFHMRMQAFQQPSDPHFLFQHDVCKTGVHAKLVCTLSTPWNKKCGSCYRLWLPCSPKVCCTTWAKGMDLLSGAAHNHKPLHAEVRFCSGTSFRRLLTRARAPPHLRAASAALRACCKKFFWCCAPLAVTCCQRLGEGRFFQAQASVVS